MNNLLYLALQGPPPPAGPWACNGLLQVLRFAQGIDETSVLQIRAMKGQQ